MCRQARLVSLGEEESGFAVNRDKMIIHTLQAPVFLVTNPAGVRWKFKRVTEMSTTLAEPRTVCRRQGMKTAGSARKAASSGFFIAWRTTRFSTVVYRIGLIAKHASVELSEHW